MIWITTTVEILWPDRFGAVGAHMISGAQIRDVRLKLGWTRRRLAQRARVRIFTIKQMEDAIRPNVFPGYAAVVAALNEGAALLDRLLSS